MDLKALHGALQQSEIDERRATIDRKHKLPVKRQAGLPGISRAAEYYRPAADPRFRPRADVAHRDLPQAEYEQEAPRHPVSRPCCAG